MFAKSHGIFRQRSHCVLTVVVVVVVVVGCPGKLVGDPQQHVGQERAADQGPGHDIRAVALLQLHDRPRHLPATGGRERLEIRALEILRNRTLECPTVMGRTPCWENALFRI